MGTARWVGQIQADVGRGVPANAWARLLLRVPGCSWAVLRVPGSSWQPWCVHCRSWTLLGALGVVFDNDLKAQMFPKACVLQRRSSLSEIVGRSWARLGVPRRSWALLGVLGRSLGAWGGLGAVWAPSWGGPGAVLGRSWAVLGRLGSVLSPSWRVWGRS